LQKLGSFLRVLNSLQRDRGYQWGEGPVAFRSNIGIPSEQAKALANELL